MISLPPRAPRKRVETDILNEIRIAIEKIPGVRTARICILVRLALRAGYAVRAKLRADP